MNYVNLTGASWAIITQDDGDIRLLFNETEEELNDNIRKVLERTNHHVENIITYKDLF